MNFYKTLNSKYQIEAKLGKLPQTHEGSFDPNNILLADVVSALDVCEGLDKSVACKETLEKIKLLVAPNSTNDDWIYPNNSSMKKGQSLNWQEIVNPTPAVMKDPKVLLDGQNNKTYEKHPRGYFRDLHFEPKKFASLIHGIENEDYIYRAWKRGDLSPAISINGKLWDGTHRCLFAYWLGVDIPVVDLKI